MCIHIYQCNVLCCSVLVTKAWRVDAKETAAPKDVLVEKTGWAVARSARSARVLAVRTLQKSNFEISLKITNYLMCSVTHGHICIWHCFYNILSLLVFLIQCYSAILFSYCDKTVINIWMMYFRYNLQYHILFYSQCISRVNVVYVCLNVRNIYIFLEQFTNKSKSYI